MTLTTTLNTDSLICAAYKTSLLPTDVISNERGTLLGCECRQNGEKNKTNIEAIVLFVKEFDSLCAFLLRVR